MYVSRNMKQNNLLIYSKKVYQKEMFYVIQANHVIVVREGMLLFMIGKGMR